MNITVIIRSMGRPTLERALASVRAQGLPEVSSLVIDAKARGLRRAQAAQAGLNEVQTPWALFLDDDDELLEGHLKKLATALHSNPQAVAAYTGVEQRVEGLAQNLAAWDRAFEPWELLAANALPIHAVLFDVPRLRQANVHFDDSFDTFEDWDFWLQVQCAGPMVYTPGISAVYWLAAPRTEPAPLSTGQSSQSGAQSAQHGDERYAAIWRKWWTRAPAEWWHQMWRAARDEPLLRRQFIQTEAAKHQAEQALVQSSQAFNQARLQLESLQALEIVLREELGHLQSQLEGARAQWAHESAEHRQTRAERDQVRIAEQGARWHLQAVLASRSWRMTSPLRWLGRQARRIWRLRLADARRNWWWRLRHRSYPRPALLAAVLPDPYQAWIEQHEGHGESDLKRVRAEWVLMQQEGQTLPLISVLMPVYNPPMGFWKEAIESVLAQWYPHWELCIADDASTDPQVREQLQAWAARDARIRWVSRPENGHIAAASNSALELARGNWVALFDQDDLLPPDALWRVAQVARAYPQAALMYSDEDKVDESGRRFGPYFKPAFDLDLLRGQNMISHLGVYQRSLLQEVGGFREGYEGSQDHDLALRCVERLQPHQVVHIPRVLYHWRVHQDSTASGSAAKPYALDAGMRAVQDHLTRSGVPAHVQPHAAIPHHVVVHIPPQVPIGEPALQGRGVVGRALLWGRGGTDSGGSQARETALASLLQGDSGLQEVTTVADWQTACQQVKAWAAQGHHGTVLLLQDELLQHWPAQGLSLETVRAHLAERGVGAIGWALRDEQGALLDAGWVRTESGAARPVACGAGLETHGYYGQLCLAHRVSALSGAAVMLRLEALEPGRPGLQLKRLWRAVWTPQAQWIGVPRGRVFPSGGRVEHPPKLVLEAADLQPGWSDPCYSPHLCAEHADHRLASAATAPRAPQSTVAFRVRPG